MVTPATIAATLLYLLPVAVLLAARLRRDTEAWELALVLPFAAAVDLLSILVLACFVRLEAAVLVSRALWLLGGAGVVVARTRRRTLELPGDLAPRDLVPPIVASVLAVLLSLRLSRPYAIWDRLWHIPLVSSLRAQRIPFNNVYDPRGGLHYHFSGDILAAALQTLSGGVIHASLALSLAHDITFGLTGATVTLLLRHFGVRGVVPASAAALGVLLTGPLALLRGGMTRPAAGYSVLNFLTLSFRPHVSLAGLLFVGFVGAVLVRLGDGEAPPARRTAPFLLATTALLAITDEASIGLLGLALGVTWLFAPGAIHPRRAGGAAVLAGLAVAVVLPNLLFRAALAPGAEHHTMALVPWRSPGYDQAPLPLASAAGRWMLTLDVLPVVALWAAGGVLSLGSRRLVIRASFVFLTVLAGTSVLALTRVEVDHSPLETHRFLTAAMVVAPLFGAVWLAVRREEVGLGRSLGSLPGAAVLAAIALSAASTVEWLVGVAPAQAEVHAGLFHADDLYEADCRRDVGASFGEAAAPAYIEPPVWYLYAGCRPIFAPAPGNPQNWQLKVKAPRLELDALAALGNEMLGAGDPVTAVCAARGKSKDPVCGDATVRSECDPAGKRVVRCSLSAEERRALLVPKR
jgi:hypothetical protein